MSYQLGLILLLICLNGAFAMSEMALVSARKVRLQQLAESGDAGAATALELAQQPTRFLSTVQVGITTIGILSGALGESAVADPLKPWLETIPPLRPYAAQMALAATVIAITFTSLVVGELVPKRLALHQPEAIARWAARPLHWLSLAALPVVKALTLTTDLVLWLLRVRAQRDPSITEEEIKVLLAQGTEEGVFEESEQKFMENILRLDDRKVGAILTPRKEVVYLDLSKPFDENRRRILDHQHWILPLCRGGWDEVVGLVKTKDLLNRMLLDAEPDLEAIASPALFVLDSLTLMEVLEQFRAAQLHSALVVDEYGEIEGLVALSDVLQAIVGDLPSSAGDSDPDYIQREDGSWLIDGRVPVDILQDLFDLDPQPDGDRSEFHTVGGFVMLHLGRIPKSSDHFCHAGLRVEVVDMDGHRVDKILVSRLPSDSGDTAP